MREWLKKAGLLKLNFRGELIPVGAGIIFVFTCVIYWFFYQAIVPSLSPLLERLIFLVIIVGGAGLIDDVLGEKDTKGFKGHFSSLFKGKLTTGALKALVIMGAVFLIVDKDKAVSIIFLDTALILLMTNLFNLLDLRPGRVVKVFVVLSFITAMFVTFFWPVFFPVYIIIIPYSYYELKGKVMLGDTGSNALGAIVGFAFSYWKYVPGKVTVTLLLVFLTLLSEKYSFTEYIAKNRILNWIDQLGRS